jgi:hypothetical protein
VAWVGTGIAIIGLAMGIGGGVAAMNASSVANADVAQVQAHIPVWNMGQAQDQKGVKPMGADVAPPNVCNPSVLGASKALTNEFYSACNVVLGDMANYHTAVSVLAAGWVIFGLGVVGTTIYTIVDWVPHRAGAPVQAAPPPVAVLPVVSPSFKGIGVVGTF